jgi:hypothetical protein
VNKVLCQRDRAVGSAFRLKVVDPQALPIVAGKVICFNTCHLRTISVVAYLQPLPGHLVEKIAVNV